MFGKNRIVNKHGLKMVGLKRISGITKRTQQGRIFWHPDTGEIGLKSWSGAVYIGRYNGPMTMQEIADAIFDEYFGEEGYIELAEENGWRVKE